MRGEGLRSDKTRGYELREVMIGERGRYKRGKGKRGDGVQARNSVTPLARSSRHTSRHSKNTTFFVMSRHWAKTKIVTSLVVTSRHTLFKNSP